MKKILVGSALMTLSYIGVMPTASAQECGTVAIASMNWQSAEVLASIDKLILEKGFGCAAETTIGDTVPTITSMAEKGQPDIAPEAWIDQVPEVMKRGVEAGNIVIGADTFTKGGLNGWWIPKYVADAHPDIKTIVDALKHPELFPDPEDPRKGAIFNGPQGWAGAVVTSQIFKGFEAEKAGFRLVARRRHAGEPSYSLVPKSGVITSVYHRHQFLSGC